MPRFSQSKIRFQTIVFTFENILCLFCDPDQYSLLPQIILSQSYQKSIFLKLVLKFSLIANNSLKTSDYSKTLSFQQFQSSPLPNPAQILLNLTQIDYFYQLLRANYDLINHLYHCSFGNLIKIQLESQNFCDL